LKPNWFDVFSDADSESPHMTSRVKMLPYRDIGGKLSRSRDTTILI